MKRCKECGQVTTYNGWPNRATWAVKLHIDNSEASQDAALAMAVEAVESAKTCAQVKDGTWTAERAQVYMLADGLKDWIEREMDDALGDVQSFGGLLARDLIDDSCDWERLAEALIEDAAEIRA